MICYIQLAPEMNQTKNNIQLDYGLRSDGYMVSVLFSSITKGNLYKKTSLYNIFFFLKII